MARIVFVLWLVFLWGAPRPALGHDLAVDQLTLWPEPGAGKLRGQLLFDPQLTRPRSAPADDVARARVLAFVRANLRVEVDGRDAALEPQVRELWTGDGAVAGDSVMLVAPLPRGARELRVFVGAPLRGIAISVEMPNAEGSLIPRSALVAGGQWSPAYRFALGELSERWALGGPDELRLGALRHGEEGPPVTRDAGSFEREPAAGSVRAKPEVTEELHGGVLLRVAFVAAALVAFGAVWGLRRKLRKR